MPYKNMPQSMWGKMDKCVSEVQSKGNDKKSAIAICYTSMMTGKEIAETMKSFKLKAAPNYRVTQKASDKPSDYLIVEDKSKPTTWHLQVKKDGAPDHTLMGAAWAALHGGYRGNKYEGPNKQTAIDKLKKLYDAEQMPTPSEKEISSKSIMDAPNLRGDDLQRCLNCKYAQAIVTDDMAMPMATDMPMQNTTMMETQKDMCADLICTQFDFMTEPDFVCDGYEAIPPQSDMQTMKQADGHYRWIIFSSSSYQDKDQEIVSQKALEADTERMNTTKEFGTLDWWHTPITLGTCDFSAMHGRISIESGLFNDDWVGERFATAKGLGASRTFYNPANEPDAQGVYHHIKTFKRAILPIHRASNYLGLLVDVSAKEKTTMFENKIAELKKLLGNTPEAEAKVKELLTAAETTDKAAGEAGLTSKETAKEEVPATSPEPEKKTVFIGDMTMEEFDAKLTATVERFLTPAVKEIGAQVAKMNEAQQITAKETSAKLAEQIESIRGMAVDNAARIAVLDGMKPSGTGYRPDKDKATIVSKETVEKAQPKGDKQVEDSLSNWLAQA